MRFHIKFALNYFKTVTLKSFMAVAGDDAHNDMAGEEEDSWKSILEANGFEVVVVTTGLGENLDFTRIFVNHAVDAAKEAGIDLN